MELEEEFIPDELALELKKIGFKKECFRYQHTSENIKESNLKNMTDNDIVGIPLWQQAFDFFREEFKIHTSIQEYDINNYTYLIDDGVNKDIQVIGFKTYKEARLECLRCLIKLKKY